jgi:hypothetical protein
MKRKGVRTWWRFKVWPLILGVVAVGTLTRFTRLLPHVCIMYEIVYVCVCFPRRTLPNCVRLLFIIIIVIRLGGRRA